MTRLRSAALPACRAFALGVAVLAATASGSFLPVAGGARQASLLGPDLAAGAEQVLEAAYSAVAEPGPAEPVEVAKDPVALEVLTGTVRPGSTISSLLVENGVERARIRDIQTAMKPAFDFRGAKAGDSFVLTQDADGKLVSFQYQRGRSDVYRVIASDGELRVSHDLVPAERRIARIGGVVSKSLFQALIDQGERSELVDQFADIFVWQIDFSQESQPGDEYRVIFEKYYDAQGFVRYGKILAAQYTTPEVDLTAIYYESDRGHGDYYAPSGRSLRRSFLKAPVRFTRISSGYSKARLHPILNRPIPHEAIDYAAPTGTPVWVVADGKVVDKNWMGGLGRTVAVEHGNGCVTYYGHLSRYGDEVEVGGKVEQKRVIGYVGNSGLATGPHLDFRMKCNGKYVDPAQVRFRPEDGSPIRMEELFAFEKVKRDRTTELRIANPPLMLEAAM